MAAIFLLPAAEGSLVDIDGTFFVQLGLFLFIFVFLYFVLFRPVVRLIEARRVATEGAKSEAAAFTEETEKLRLEVDSQISDIRSAAREERDRVVEQARRQERELTIKAREESRKAVDTARAEMERRGEDVRGRLQSQVEGFAQSVASRVLGRSL
jgi:F-type H+-transporting ATPase subunit b